MSVFHNNALIGAGGGAAAAADPAVATKSLRFNPGDTSFISRTFGSSGDRTNWSWSGWVKRSTLVGVTTTRQVLFGGYGGANDTDWLEFGFGEGTLDKDDTVYLTTQSISDSSGDSIRFRDLSAWYHYFASYDGSNIKIYINNTLVLTKALTGNRGINGNWLHTSGKSPKFDGRYFSGYLTDVYFIDGATLTPSSFGAYDSNGVWQAALYSGTYGTNGFHLAFGDSSSSAALGTDSSGNSNTFTVNNISGDAVGLATANQGFDVVTYTGTGSTQSISGLNFQSDLVWIKPRNVSDHHILYDSVRGVRKQLYTTLTNAEETETQGLSAFTSDGFTVNGAHTVRGQTNDSSNTYVAWCWKAGGSASSNTDGTITSSVSASTTYGFSVVAYTGNNTSGATVGHSLSSVPKWIVVKSRGQAGQFWHVYHASLAANEYIYLNSNAAKTSGNDFMNGTRPTSSVFSLGNGNGCNKSSDNVIAYCWSEVSGFSKFSSFSGTGSSGNAVTTGFKPRLVLLKRTDTTGNWFIFDSERGTGGTVWADLSDAEDSNYSITLRNDGFNVNGSAAGMNASGGTYIYAAFASKPSGEEIDSLFDVPTNGDQSDTGAGGEVSGNYCCLNPLANSGMTLSNGNLDFTSDASNRDTCIGTMAVSSGKWYWEVEVTGLGALIGIEPDDHYPAAGDRTGLQSAGYAWRLDDGFKFSNNGTSASFNSGTSVGDVIGVALDLDGGTLKFYRNGSLVGTAFTGISGTYLPSIGDGSNTVAASGSVNFGQRAWAYSAPSNHKALCTTNLPTPTIADGSGYHDTLLYTGNGASSRTISGFSFSPDFLWVKVRTATGGDFSPRIMDAVRGAGVSLRTNGTDAERDSSATTGGGVETFTSDGFTIQAGGGSNINANNNNSPYVAWGWDAGSSTVSNTDGSITSNVRANQSVGFSIVSYTGNGSSGTVGHGLNAAPEMIIAKDRDASTNWFVYHTSLGSNAILLNSTAAAFSPSPAGINAASSSTFTLGGARGETNTNGNDYIAYCISPVAGFSAVGSYIGNASNNGSFQFTGFRVKWLMVKGSSYASNWNIVDATRNEFNETDLILRSNLSNAEFDGSAQGAFALGFDFLSNGFKVRRSGVDVNKSGGTLIWAAFAEHPFKTARAR